MILAEGALLVAKATAIRVSTRNAARADRKVEDWGRGDVERRETSESGLFPAKSKESLKVRANRRDQIFSFRAEEQFTMVGGLKMVTPGFCLICCLPIM